MLIPIRIKILGSVLVLLMLSVAVITAVMAQLFHSDKTVYVKDLAAVTATSAQSEVDTLLANYASTTQAFADIVAANYLDPAQKERSAAALFATHPAAVAVTAYAPDGSRITLFDQRALTAVGLDASALSRDIPARGASASGTRIARIEVHRHGAAASLRIVLAGERPVVGEFRTEELSAALERVSTFGSALVTRTGEMLLANRPGQAWPDMAANELSVKSAAVIETEIGGTSYFLARGRSKAAPADVVVLVPRAATYLTARAVLTQLVWVGAALVFIAALLAMFFARRLSRPIEKLSVAADAVGAGQFDINVAVTTRDEVAQLTHSFNSMAHNLRERDARLHAANLQLVQSEKMAAVGQLSAGLAHEVKNPLAGILGFAQLTRRSLSDPEAIKNNLDVIERETRRCTEIIGNLMRFSRQEPGERAALDVNSVVERAVKLVEHQLGLKNVKIERQLGSSLPHLLGNANQIQQVLMNLLINAQQAMEPKGGTARVRTFADQGRITLEVEDTGPGIPDELRARIFEPFFTTKPAGQGTGLGLSVSYGIVRDHGGEIRAEKGADGRGARFVIVLPATAGSSAVSDTPRSKVA
jgi:two-component system, NtrC family, sensor kinase